MSTRSKCVVSDEEDGRRLDVVLVRLIERSRRQAREAIASGKVTLDGAVVREPGQRVASGSEVAIDWSVPGKGKAATTARASLTRARIRIVYEDADLLVLNKPPGLLTDTATYQQKRTRDSLRKRALEYLRPHKIRPMLVHRIDRDTSGIVLIAKDEAMGVRLKDAFAAHQPERVYWCAVRGVPNSDSGTFVDWMAWDSEALIQRRVSPSWAGAVQASAAWRLLERRGPISILEVRLHTGRRNQIRLHCQLRKMPVVGERQYLDADTKPPRSGRQALHAWRLALAHPRSGEMMRFEAPVPADVVGLGKRQRS